MARFGDTRREVVTFDEIPKILLDATTAVEDKTFWENAGFDPVAIVSAGLSSLRGDSRGASTITQQLVRARLLDEKLVQDPKRTAERKLKEIIQSIRVTQAFPGETGKQQIITAYLNQNYYGNQRYGVKAAVDSLLRDPPRRHRPRPGSDHRRPPEVALELRPGSQRDRALHDGRRRRRGLPEGGPCRPIRHRGRAAPRPHPRPPGRRPDPDVRDQFSSADFTAAKQEEVVLARQSTPQWIAPHFVWAVRDELTKRLCGDESETCVELDRGGLRVTTTLDVNLQKTAEKWVRASTIIPHAKDPVAAAKAAGFKTFEPWMKNLRDKNLRNGALVAYDYQTGELVAYVGSASYYAVSSKPAPPAAVRRHRPGLSPAGLGVQAVQLRRRHQRRHDQRRHDADGRRDRFRWRLYAPTMRIASSAVRCAFGAPSSSR